MNDSTEGPKKFVLRALVLLAAACAGGYVVHLRWDPWIHDGSIKPPDQSIFLGVIPGSHHVYVIPAKSVTAARGKLHELEQIDVPHLTTIGARSGAPRHRIATLLGSVGASTSILEGAGHLVHVDNPVGTSARLQSFCSELVG